MHHGVSRYMRAHGNMPGPTHRPKATGLVSGALGGLAAAPVLWAFGSFDAVAGKTGVRPWALAVLFLASMAVFGALYGEIFGRGANDKRGGWLLGMSYGFALWMIGPVAVLQWFLGAAVVSGHSAMGLVAGQVLYGSVLGYTFPYVQDRIQRELKAL